MEQQKKIANLKYVSDILLYSVVLKKFPAHNVLSVRGRIETLKNETVLWEILEKEKASQKIQFANPSMNISVI